MLDLGLRDTRPACDAISSDGDASWSRAQITAEGECFDEEGIAPASQAGGIGCDEILAAQDKATGLKSSSPDGSSCSQIPGR